MGEEVPIDYRYAEKVPGPLYTIRERDLTHIKPQILGVGEVLYCYGWVWDRQYIETTIYGEEKNQALVFMLHQFS